MVISDALTEGELKVIPQLTPRQKELLEEAVNWGGVIYRFQLEGQTHPTIRFGIGGRRYPAVYPDAEVYETYNKELLALLEKRLVIAWESGEAFLLSWSGWRITRAMLAGADAPPSILNG